MQSDFTHYRLADGADTEVLTWLDDHSRYALSVTAHRRVTGPIVLAAFRAACAGFGTPASTLTDNGMVFTTRLSGGKGGRNHLEAELRRLGVRQKNGKPNHPQTQGKVERFQQTLKKWLRAQPAQPGTLSELQALLDAFTSTYNTRRPHRSLPHRATPATAYAARPKAVPGDRSADTHDRVRTDRVDADGKLTLACVGAVQAPPHRHRPAPRRNPRPDALVCDLLHVRVINARHRAELLRRAHHRPRQELPAHRQATRTPARNTTPAPPTQKPRTLMRVRGVLDVPRHHTTPATTVPATTCKNSLLISPCSGEGLVLCWPVASGGNRPATVGLGEYVAKSHTMAFGWPPSPRKAWCIGFPLIWCPEPPIQRRSTLLCRDLSVSASGAGLSMSARWPPGGFWPGEPGQLRRPGVGVGQTDRSRSG